jgi:hypothetical protein
MALVDGPGKSDYNPRGWQAAKDISMPAPIKLPEPLDGKLTAIAKRRHTTRAKALGDALEALDKQTARPTVASLAGDLIGSVTDAPADLSTNPKHMADFGR